jgi:hypothetical protein
VVGAHLIHNLLNPADIRFGIEKSALDGQALEKGSAHVPTAFRVIVFQKKNLFAKRFQLIQSLIRHRLVVHGGQVYVVVLRETAYLVVRTQLVPLFEGIREARKYH